MPADAMPAVTAAVEGDLDEALLRRLADHVGFSIGNVHGRKGKSSLLQSMRGYNAAARRAPWVVLVDLDRDGDCAPPCVARWLPDPSALMCFRVAVRAVEAWLLADRERVAAWLGIGAGEVPGNPDDLDDPKRALIDLARRSRRRGIRGDLVPRAGSGRPVGPLYNARAIEFVQDRRKGWRPGFALRASDSLSRCVARLRQFSGAGAQA